jgi:hypothetical protein
MLTNNIKDIARLVNQMPSKKYSVGISCGTEPNCYIIFQPVYHPSMFHNFAEFPAFADIFHRAARGVPKRDPSGVSIIKPLPTT